MKTTPDTRPLAERITQGSARTLELQVNHVRLTPRGAPTVQVFDEDRENVAVFVEHAHGELFNEAFTVCHETRRTPRQLVDERTELIAALRENMKTVKIYSEDAAPGSIRALQIQQASELLTRLQS